MKKPFQPTEQGPVPTTDVYSEQALWLCANRQTGFKTRIHGALAQILKKYPQDYRLKLLSTPGGRNEQSAATGQ